MGVLEKGGFPTDILLVPVADIYYDPTQPRQNFALEGLIHLAHSIARNGLQKPITLRPIEKTGLSPNLESMLAGQDKEFNATPFFANRRPRTFLDAAQKYFIITGERRFRAHIIGNIEVVRSQVVSGLTELEVLAMQNTENSQEPYPPYETAEAIVDVYFNLVEAMRGEGKFGGLSYSELSVILGKKETEIVRAFRYHDLHPSIKEAVAQDSQESPESSGIGGSNKRKLKPFKLSFAVACEIGRVKDKSRQLQLYQKAAEKQYSARAVRTLVNEILAQQKPFLREEVLQEITERVHKTAEPILTVIVGYGAKALSEVRFLMTGEDRGCDASKQMLSTAAIAEITAETTGLPTQYSEFYFQRRKLYFASRINTEMRRLTYPKNLFGYPILPTEGKYYREEREKYYSLLDKIRQKIYSFIQLVGIQPELKPRLVKRLASRGLDTILESFARGLVELNKVIPIRQTIPSHHEGRIYSNRGAAFMLERVEETAYQPDGKILELELEQIIKVSNVRKTFNQKRIERLADSIEAQGQQEPILVNRMGEEGHQQYGIVTGERRYRALMLLRERGVHRKIRAINISGISAIDRARLQIVEGSQEPFNLQNYAAGLFRQYKRMNIDEFQRTGKLVSVKQFAKAMGKDPDQIRELFAILTLPSDILPLVGDLLPRSHAVAISYLPQMQYPKDHHTKRYAYEPETDIQLSPEQIFNNGINPCAELQKELAVYAIYRRPTRTAFRSLLNQYDNRIRRDLIFTPEDLNRCCRQSERYWIEFDLSNTLQLFENSIKATIGLASQRDTGYHDNVFHYPRMRLKAAMLKQAFEELCRLLDYSPSQHGK